MMSGHGLDERGKKMSKSKGNVVMPELMLNRYSVDSVRYWAASATLGEDLHFAEKDIVTGQGVLTKLWNAARFVEMYRQSCDLEQDIDDENINELLSSAVDDLRVMDRWILTRLSSVIFEYHEHFTRYQITRAKNAVVQFFRHEFCDYYLELIKYRMFEKECAGDDADRSKKAAYVVASYILNSVLKLMAPFTPFICEEIYQSIYRNNENENNTVNENDAVNENNTNKNNPANSNYSSIHRTKFPGEFMVDKDAQIAGEFANRIISILRKYKSDNGFSLNAPIEHVTFYTERNLSPVVADIAGCMNIGEARVEKGKPRITEKIVNVIPDFSKIGPEFEKDTGRVSGLIKNLEIAAEIENKGEVVVEGFTLTREHIGKIERVFQCGGKDVDILEDEDVVVEIERQG